MLVAQPPEVMCRIQRRPSQCSGVASWTLCRPRREATTGEKEWKGNESGNELTESRTCGLVSIELKGFSFCVVSDCFGRIGVNNASSMDATCDKRFGLGCKGNYQRKECSEA